MPSSHEFCRNGNDPTGIVSAENISREYQFKYVEDGGGQKDANSTKYNKHNTKPWTWEEVAGLGDLQLKYSDISLKYMERLEC